MLHLLACRNLQGKTITDLEKERRNMRSFEKYPEKLHFQLHRKEERKFK